MPLLTLPTDMNNRPIVRVRIGVHSSLASAYAADNESPPPAWDWNALIDTGCDTLAISPRIVQQLSITPTNTVQRHTASGSVEVGVYDVSVQVLAISGIFLDMPDLRGVPCHRLAPGLGFDVLIGRSPLALMTHCIFKFRERAFSLEL